MAARSALITGIVGQDGSYLAQLLLQKGYHVVGLKRASSSLVNHDWLGITSDIEYVDCDLQDEAKLTGIITQRQPAELYHLGGLSAPGDSWAAPRDYTVTNALGTLAILEAVRLYAPATKLLNAATSEMFGNSHQQGFQTEQTPL
jgi:GDPmannose 4,6-dehydratase